MHCGGVRGGPCKKRVAFEFGVGASVRSCSPKYESFVSV